MGPHRQGTRRSSSRRLSSFTKSPGRPTRRWRAGWTATPGPVRLGQEGRRGRLRTGDDPFQMAEDLRRISADGPNMARFADIAYVKTRQGRLYPTLVMDIWSRRIVGWAMGPGITAELADETLKMALTRRNNPRGCMHHSDYRAQYVSLPPSKTVRERGVRPSMGSISSP